ncbi:MAG TPA: HEPN domain-containing protein [Bacteroidia bacterium]|nr:HEPN domain-containing protein [Bacteroidia bacterium]
MQSFRTEIENPLVEKDILDLERKIHEFREGKIHEEKFRSLRLARGVYGQRQQGVQMIRIKLPFGKITAKQLLRMADISDEYSTGNLHLTTRQDIQIHHVSLDKTPELWAKLEQDDITLREACGNTVRNVTASAEAGIDPSEPFDVSPYAFAVFNYFLRKPFGQELGRKIKIAFSNSDADTAFTFIHDIGFIPKVKIENGIEQRGFKVLLAGGLGAQPILAQTAFEFLHEDRIIPFIESALRVFDRHGERANRHKARLKYLVSKIGLTEFLKLAEQEEKTLLNKTYIINRNAIKPAELPKESVYTTFRPADEPAYNAWKATNAFPQKQHGYYGVYIKVLLGNIGTAKARELARIVKTYAADDLRITINQGFLLRFVREEALLALYNELKKINLVDAGFNSVADITACPGTDTCNLAISNSTNITVELEKVIYGEFPDLIYNHDIKIKISGCMNSCGQHGLAQIGFHGSSFKAGSNVVPALQLLLGGGTLGNGEGRTGDKIIKVPSKRGPDLLRTLLNDFADGLTEGELFNTYYDRRGKDYFYQLLKPLADASSLKDADFIDWGQEEKFKPEIGVGECAGVVIDLVATLFFEAEEKLQWSKEAFEESRWGDSIYYSYAALISGAKALLLDKQVHVNTHHVLISDFDKHFVETKEVEVKGTFKDLALKINRVEPSRAFADRYFSDAEDFLKKIKTYRSSKVLEETISSN